MKDLVLFIVLILLIIHLYSDDKITDWILFFILLTYLLLLVIHRSVSSRRRKMRKLSEADLLEQVHMDHIQRLVDSVRELKHDFANHIQVIHGLAKNESLEALKEYAQNLVEEIHEIPALFDTKNPIVNALLHSKLAYAESKKIQVQVDVYCPLLFDAKTSYLFVKILSNLMDNAIDALMDVNQPKILITIKRDEKNYLVSVENNGPPISEQLQEKIFEKGFSTKKGKPNRGYGLSIVREMIDQLGGSLTLRSTQQQTVFEFSLPYH